MNLVTLILMWTSFLLPIKADSLEHNMAAGPRIFAEVLCLLHLLSHAELAYPQYFLPNHSFNELLRNINEEIHGFIVSRFVFFVYTFYVVVIASLNQYFYAPSFCSICGSLGGTTLCACLRLREMPSSSRGWPHSWSQWCSCYGMKTCSDHGIRSPPGILTHSIHLLTFLRFCLVCVLHACCLSWRGRLRLCQLLYRK